MNEIIKPEEVMETLLDGFEVLYIDKNSKNRFGLECRMLTEVIYSVIEKIVDEADEDSIFIKTEKENQKAAEDQND